MHALHILRLSWTLNRNARLKLAVLCLLTAVGMSAFLWLTELSRSSIANLDSAVQAELGTRGQYTVSFTSNLGLGSQGLIATVTPALRAAGAKAIEYAEQLPAVTPQCPPYESADQVGLVVFRDANGAYAAFEPAPLPEQFDLCLQGQMIPATAVRETSAAERRAIGYALVISGDYQLLARLTSATPLRITAIATLGEDGDRRDAIAHHVEQVLEPVAAQAGVPIRAAFSVFKVNEGQQVRSASDGVRLVYGLIAWGILLLIGLSVLVAQLFMLRDRTWLLGLARAVGARRQDLAALVAAEVIGVTTIGACLAVLANLLLQPVAGRLGETAFNVQLQVVRPSSLLQLLMALLVAMGIGAVYPALKAIRLDPAEVLESR